MTTLDVYSTPEKWEEISRHPYYRDMREELSRAGEEFLARPIPPLTLQAWLEYRKKGTRDGYEKNYFHRRGRLVAFALLTRLTGEPRWKTALEETIWAICEEFAWAVPAHLVHLEGLAEMPFELDLFSTETAFALGEVDALLGDRLSPEVRQRIKLEVRRRVIEPFLSIPARHWRWENWENNWTAVCASGITHALIYLGEPGELEAVLDQLLSYVKCFLAGFPEDGACLEGSSYWLYGFGFFAQMAQTLFYHTGGELDLLSWDKVERIAGFLQKTCLCGRWAVMISDANNMEFVHDSGLSHMLSARFPDIPLLPDALRRPFGMDECYRFGTLLRNLLWTSPGNVGGSYSPKNEWFPGAQWYVENRDSYACVLKGGCNDEPHNHNDVGHVSVASRDEGYLLCDLGAGRYTADYFQPSTRYAKLNTASRGHSVPIINGKEQLTGREYNGLLSEPGANTTVVEFSRAYGQPELKHLERTLSFYDHEVFLTDVFDFTAPPRQLRERFVTGIAPVKTAQGLAVGEMLLKWNDDVWETRLSEESYDDHYGDRRTAYFMDFVPRVLVTHLCFELKIAIGRQPKEEITHAEQQ